MSLPDKNWWLDFWGYTPGTPEAEEKWAAKVKMTLNPTRAGYSIIGTHHYDNLQAPDGTDISSRTKHREYKARTGLVDFDDYKGTFEAAQKERDAYHSGEKGTINRKDIEKSIAQLTGQA